MRLLHYRSQSGQAMIWGTMSLTVLFGALGFAVDLGYSFSVKQRLQVAADAAAGAAAKYASDHLDSCGTGGTISCPATLTCARIQTPTNSLQAGCDYGLTGAPSGMTLTLTENTGGLTGNTAQVWIQATASMTSRIFFVSNSTTSATIKAQATGGVTAFSGAGCIYVLDGTAPQALYASGSTTVTSSGCGIYVASSASNGADVEGSSTVNATGTAKVVVHCGTCYTTGGGSTIYYGSHHAPDVAATTDPLASWFTSTNSTWSSWSASGCNANPNLTSGSGTATLNPGVYCGGITVAGNNTVKLNPGTYILDGGGFNISRSATINGTGVTIFNTSDSSNPAGAISIAGSAIVNLTAPTSGIFQGVVFFQPTLTNGASISNSATPNITGTYYLPKANLSLTGSVGMSSTAAFVVDTLTVDGSCSLTNDPTGQVTGLNKWSAGLID